MKFQHSVGLNNYNIKRNRLAFAIQLTHKIKDEKVHDLPPTITLWHCSLHVDIIPYRFLTNELDEQKQCRSSDSKSIIS